MWLATSPDVANVSGGYFADRKQRLPARFGEDDAAAKRSWEISEELVATVG